MSVGLVFKPGRAFRAARVRAAVLFLFSVPAASVASAQTSQPTLEALLMPGMTAWITDASGREEKSRVVGVSSDVVTITVRDHVRRLRSTEIRRVRVRRSDSLINGALIGAGAAVASGLVLCTLTEPWENCRDDVGPMMRIGAAACSADHLSRRARTTGLAALLTERSNGIGEHTSPERVCYTALSSSQLPFRAALLSSSDTP
jgi:hypothetical protein